MKIKIKKLKENTKLPKYAHPGDVGMDLFSMEKVVINPGERHFFYHGFAMEFPEGYAAIVKDKSSISKAGLTQMGGVFDAGFRGEYNTLLVNLSSEPYTVEEGDKVSQIVILPVVIAEIEETDTLSDSSRGIGAFGSTGKK
jgi:dUTP pyrophosphatase